MRINFLKGLICLVLTLLFLQLISEETIHLTLGVSFLKNHAIASDTLPITEELLNWEEPVLSSVDIPLNHVSMHHKAVKAGYFQKIIENKGIFVSLILVFFAGVGMSFTPCIYAVIPITITILSRQAKGGQTTTRKPPTAILLSLIYVLGISIVYSFIGLAAASTGSLVGKILQSSWAIGFISALFIGLALSMFGVYDLRVPSFILDRLAVTTKKSLIGIFIMGLASGIVIVLSPCVGPVFASLLIYIASTGNKFLGFWMLFIFAWGLGALLIVLGTFSGAIKAIPKSGKWMLTVERVFGLVLIGAALYYLRLIIPESIFIIVLGLFLIVISVFSGGFDRLTSESTVFERVKKSFGVVAFIFGTYFIVGYLIMRGFILPTLLT